MEFWGVKRCGKSNNIVFFGNINNRWYKIRGILGYFVWEELYSMDMGGMFKSKIPRLTEKGFLKESYTVL